MELLDEVLEAHGGVERWRRAAEFRVHARSGGFLLATRAPRRMFADLDARIVVDEPWVRFDMAGTEEVVVFDHGRVRMETPDGDVIDERDDPRSLFFGRSGLRRNLRWDPLDLTYFAGYAWWNYATTPLLFTRPEVDVSEGEPWRQAPGGETWRRLDARFDPKLDTHSEEQTFWVGPDGLLRRHDYTADIIGGWAKGAHVLAEHREFGGLVFPTKRRVTPRGPGGRGLPFPTLVRLDIEGIEVIERRGAGE